MIDYEREALEFLKNSNTDISIEYEGAVYGFPFGQDSLMHNKYKVTLSREGKSYSFPFYGSYHDYEKHIDPNEYDVLAVLEKYDVEPDVWDFADEFGYEINSRKTYNKVCKIHSECRDQYRELCHLFGREWMEKLREIN